MDFLLTESQKALKRSIRNFINHEIRPFIKESNQRRLEFEKLIKNIAEKWPRAMFGPSGEGDADLTIGDRAQQLAAGRRPSGNPRGPESSASRRSLRFARDKEHVYGFPPTPARGVFPPPLSCLDYVVILEEISKAIPDWRLVLAFHKILGLKHFLLSGLINEKPNQLPPLGTAAFALGFAACALEQGICDVKKKAPPGHDAKKIEAVRLAIAEGLAELETARLQMYRAAFLEDRGRSSLAESAAAGAFAREVALKATSMIVPGKSRRRFNLGILAP